MWNKNTKNTDTILPSLQLILLKKHTQGPKPSTSLSLLSSHRGLRATKYVFMDQPSTWIFLSGDFELSYEKEK